MIEMIINFNKIVYHVYLLVSFHLLLTDIQHMELIGYMVEEHKFIN